ERGVARGCGLDPATPTLQDAAHALEDQRVVVDHDHPLAACGIGDGRQRRWHLPPARLCSQWHGHREARAAAGARIQFDRVAEQVAKPVDDCKTQAETIAAVGRTARELVELAEYTLPFVCRNAGPGIADIDAQLGTAVAATDHHPASLRVAHRIGYEIK